MKAYIITCRYICVPPEYISAGLPGLGGCSFICKDGGTGDCTNKTFFSTVECPDRMLHVLQIYWIKFVLIKYIVKKKYAEACVQVIEVNPKGKPREEENII